MSKIIFLKLQKVIDAEFFVVVQRQLADHRAERDLRRSHVHFVENFRDLYHNLAIAKDDDRVGALVGDDLGVADRDRFRRCIDWLRREFF